MDWYISVSESVSVNLLALYLVSKVSDKSGISPPLFVTRYNCLVRLHTLPELLPKKGTVTKSEVWCHFGLRHEAN